MSKPKDVSGPPGNLDLVAEIHAAATVSAATPEANEALKRLDDPRWIPDGWRWMREWYEAEIKDEGDDAEDDVLHALANGKIRFAILTVKGTFVDFGAESAPLWRKETDAGALAALRSGKGGFTRQDGSYDYGHIFVRDGERDHAAEDVSAPTVDLWFESEYIPKHRDDDPPPTENDVTAAVRDRFPLMKGHRPEARRLRQKKCVPDSWHDTGPRGPHTGSLRKR